MKKLLREPLLHFLLLGAALFALHAWRSSRQPAAASTAQIEVNAAVIARLSAAFERQSARAPDEDELRGLVAAHIREEILYREALALGLDRDDTIVRRRMAQKMEFLTDDVATSTVAPDDAALQRFFADNAARYAKPARVSFRHVYFSREKRGDAAEAAAREAGAALASGASEETLGDAFLHGFEFTEQEPADLVALFGQEFAEHLGALHEGAWSRPLASSYGFHLVHLVHRSSARPTTLDESRDTVVRDFLDERRRAANREVFERLRERYRIVIDEDALVQATLPKTKTAQR